MFFRKPNHGAFAHSVVSDQPAFAHIHLLCTVRLFITGTILKHLKSIAYINDTCHTYAFTCVGFLDARRIGRQKIPRLLLCIQVPVAFFI